MYLTTLWYSLHEAGLRALPLNAALTDTSNTILQLLRVSTPLRGPS